MQASTARPPIDTYQRAMRSLSARMRRLRSKAGVLKSSRWLLFEEAVMGLLAKSFMRNSLGGCARAPLV
ncbi:hypothetical protein D3C84_1279890 [compost metagenome]